MTGTRTVFQIFKIPAVLTVVSLAGLIMALLIEGPADFAAALTAGAPIGVVAWFWAAQAKLRGALITIKN